MPGAVPSPITPKAFWLAMLLRYTKLEVADPAAVMRLPVAIPVLWSKTTSSAPDSTWYRRPMPP